MRFTSAIVTTANKLVKMGYSRSEATKMAFARTRSEYKLFCRLMADGQVVTVAYRADKHAGEIQQRLAASIGAAIEAGLLELKGADTPDYPHLHTYFDLTKGEVRKFKKQNFVNFSI